MASAGADSCLCKQKRVIEKFYAKPKVFGSKFYAGLRVKNLQEIENDRKMTVLPTYAGCEEYVHLP